MQQPSTNPNLLHELATQIGQELEARYPAVPIEGTGLGLIPDTHAAAISEEITAVVAQILQSWLNAGSERDVTLEELYDPIAAHISGWTDSPRNAPSA